MRHCPHCWIAAAFAGAASAQQWALEQPAWLPPTHIAPAAGDFDGDGDQDLAIAVFPYGVRVLQNDGTGAFLDVSAAVPIVLFGVVTNLLFVDVDADGREELFVSAYGGNGLYGTTSAGIWVNRSSGLPGGLGPVYAIAGDFDLDGDLDMAAAGNFLAPSYNTLLTNSGAGTFSSSPFPLATPFAGSSYRVAAGDIDGDGDLDVLFAHPTQLLRNDGNMIFTTVTATQFGSSANASFAEFADLDGDGDVDLALVDGVNNLSQVLRNNGTGVFSVVAGAVSQLASPPRGMRLVDADEDGDLDLFRSQQNGPPLLSRNSGSGSFADDPLALPATTPSNGEALAFDPDGDGDVDFLLSGMLTLGSALHNLHRHVLLPQPPQIGQPWPMHVWHEPGYATAPRPCWLGIGAIRLAQPFLLPPFGRLWLDLSTPFLVEATTLPTGAGPTIRTLPIPNLPAFVGVPLHVQALIEGPQGLAAARFTNVASRTIQ